jgi:hypothetical protein
MKLRRLFAVTAVAVAAVGLTACGNKEEVTTFGHTEGAYLNVGNLVYQVQISRVLNPKDRTDRSYLIDVPADQLQLAPDEAWFGVFVIGWNESDDAQPAISDFEITDTQGNVYKPVGIGPDNVFAYRVHDIEPGEKEPLQNTAASNNPSVNGSLLLFKVKNSTFDNRPLELKIHALGGEPREAAVDLDV